MSTTMGRSRTVMSVSGRCVLHLLLVALLLVVLPGCSAQSSSSLSGALTPEQVHQQYIEALRTNDRARVLALTTHSEFQTAIADQRLAKMQDEMRAANPRTGGGLTEVEVTTIVAEGRGKRGISRWTYAKTVICHTATLVLTEEGWRVTTWGETVADCGRPS